MGVPDTLDREYERGKPPIINRDRERASFAIKAIEKGHTTTMAAQAADVSRRTLYDWRYKGEEIRRLKEENPDELPLTPYDDDYLWFLRKWEAAELKRKQTLLKKIEDAGDDPKRWTANAWLLERLHPEEFSLKHRVEVANRNDKGDVWTINIGEATARKSTETVDADFEIVDEESNETFDG